MPFCESSSHSEHEFLFSFMKTRIHSSRKLPNASFYHVLKSNINCTNPFNAQLLQTLDFGITLNLGFSYNLHSLLINLLDNHSYKEIRNSQKKISWKQDKMYCALNFLSLAWIIQVTLWTNFMIFLSNHSSISTFIGFDFMFSTS